MLGGENNLKDSIKDTKDMPAPYEAAGFRSGSVINLSYTKSGKLVTALFMITDMMDKDEPLRKKLRTLGVEMISDIYSTPIQVGSRATEIMSFLDIALAIHLISEMNHSILSKEFFKLGESVKEYERLRSTWLGEFMLDSTSDESRLDFKDTSLKDIRSLRTEATSTRIGVQKRSTLMKALKDMNANVSDRISLSSHKASQDFDVLKRQRREDITNVLKANEGGLTITDIRIKAKGLFAETGLTVPSKALISCSEKTLQRELFSMVQEGILMKTGKKRWSRYFIPKSLHSF